ncbi:MAG: hypothetical protein E7184_03280 [Erysipelotrichaceae bacterium]|nr:hypothetical protein [Erysipelotrichaceae bacterium]
MEMNINKTSVDDFYKEMFKGSDKNQQLRSLELSFNALFDNKMSILNKELYKLGKHNVFNQNGSLTMEKIQDGGFVFEIKDIKILNTNYTPIYLKGNDILNLMDQLIENISYLEAFVNIAEQSTKNLKPEEKKKFTDKIMDEAYDNFPNPTTNTKQIEKEAKIEVEVKTKIDKIIDKLPPKIKHFVETDLTNKYLLEHVSKQVGDPEANLENIVNEKVAKKVAEVIEQKAPAIIHSLDPKGKKELAQSVDNAIKQTAATQDVNIQLAPNKNVPEKEETIANLEYVDQVVNTLDINTLKKDDKKGEKGVTERPLNEEEKAKIEKNLGTAKNMFSGINLDFIEKNKDMDFKELSVEEFQQLSPEEQTEYLKKQEEFEKNFVGPRRP